MKSLLTISKAQDMLRLKVKQLRLSQGFTQKGLSIRAGVPLPTLRKFEQQGLISLESFLKILMVLGCVGLIIDALETEKEEFNSIADVIKNQPRKMRKRGWRT